MADVPSDNCAWYRCHLLGSSGCGVGVGERYCTRWAPLEPLREPRGQEHPQSKLAHPFAAWRVDAAAGLSLPSLSVDSRAHGFFTPMEVYLPTPCFPFFS